jgi:hypothetical protein
MMIEGKEHNTSSNALLRPVIMKQVALKKIKSPPRNGAHPDSRQQKDEDLLVNSSAVKLYASKKSLKANDIIRNERLVWLFYDSEIEV